MRRHEPHHARPEPRGQQRLVERTPSVRRAREAVQRARERWRGVNAADDPLQPLPFELRFLARCQPRGLGDCPSALSPA
jgi:hypothetical protein